MTRVFPLALALAAGLNVPARAQAPAAEPLRENTPVEIVGRISSPPKGALNEQKLQVAVGPQKSDYTLHFRDAALYDLAGKKIDEDGLDSEHWVYARGWVMDDPRRIRVSELRVIGKDLGSLRGTQFFREGHNQGYFLVTRTGQPAKAFGEGTPVVIVGQISSEPKNLVNEKKMQVAVGPDRRDYTLHLDDARLFGYHGGKIGVDHFKDRMWVRATGRLMDDPRRVDVSQLQVVGMGDMGFKSSAFYRPGFDHGYVTAVAGVRETFPAAKDTRFMAVPMTIVGRVSDDTGPLESTRKIQVASAGNEWTLNVTDNARVLDGKGEKVSVHEIKQGQWVRAHGWPTGDLRMRVYQVENIGPDEAFRQHKLYRSDFPLGYLERRIGTRTEYAPVKLRGTIVQVYPRYNYFTLRDESNRTRRVYADDVLITGPNGALIIENLKPGDVISIEGRTIDVDVVP